MHYKSTALWAFLLMTFSFIHTSTAQTTLDEAVRRADVSPAWPGCDAKLSDCTKSRMADFIAANLQIPLEAKAEGAGGVVMMEFVVEKNGNIGEVKALHDPGLGLGEEATRVINLMKTKKIKWTPAEDDGKKVPFRYTVPVSFNLNLPAKTAIPTAVPEPVNTNQVFDIVEVMPQYAGCVPSATDTIDCTYGKVVSHIKANLKYPDEAFKNKVQGKVAVEFVIDTNGMVIDPVIKESLGSGCDEEVVRVIMMMPAWTPGMQNGQPVKVRMNIPVFFQLPKEEK